MVLLSRFCSISALVVIIVVNMKKVLIVCSLVWMIYLKCSIVATSSGSAHSSHHYSKLSPRVVQTRYGRLQGSIVTFEQNKPLKTIETFLGVPYATPPIHSNRFSPTRAPSPWDGIRIADRLSPVCPQHLPDIRNETAALDRMPRGRLEFIRKIIPSLQNQSEDCLYLNIYAPFQNEIETKNPVLVYIHGESFEWNAGNPYDGSILASYTDLVIVTINYRLGFLGFLNANPNPQVKARVANYGLMDQMAALHWIQQNIELFGGDSANVTLMGHGSGAACINFLLMSPTVVPGLFHRAILLSGSALASWAIVDDPVTYAVRLAEQVNCTIPSNLDAEHERIVDCLRTISLESLMSVRIESPAYLNAFGPSVDGVVIARDFSKEILSLPEPSDLDLLLSRMPSQRKHTSASSSSAAAAAAAAAAAHDSNPYATLIAHMKFAGNYDILFGVASSEALLRFGERDLQNGFEGQRRDRILRTYVRNAYVYHLNEIFYTIVNEYTDWERTVQHPINTRDATIAALSDAQFIAPVVQMADLFAAAKANSVSAGTSGEPHRNPKSFFYVFDYQTKDSAYPTKLGTSHNEDLPYIFGAPLTSTFTNTTILQSLQKNYTKYEISLSESMMILINNFVRNGNPNVDQKSDQILAYSKDKYRFRSIVWEEYDSVHQKYFEIGLKPRIKNHFRAHQLSVWLRLIPELHRAGMEDVVAKHNLFKNHNNIDLYDGPVRPDPLKRLAMPLTSYKDAAAAAAAAAADQLLTTTLASNGEPLATTCITVISAANSHNQPHQSQVAQNISLLMSDNSGSGAGSLSPSATIEAIGYADYKKALNVTIVIGCSLLILNILIFAGVYYRRDKTRLQMKALQQQHDRNFEVLTKQRSYGLIHQPQSHHHHHQQQQQHQHRSQLEHESTSNSTTTIIDLEQTQPSPNTVTQSIEILTPQQSHYCLSAMDMPAPHSTSSSSATATTSSSFKTMPKKHCNTSNPNVLSPSIMYKTLPKNLALQPHYHHHHHHPHPHHQPQPRLMNSQTPNLILEHQQQIFQTPSAQLSPNPGAVTSASTTTNTTTTPENQPLLLKNLASKLPQAAISEMRV